MQLCSLDRFTGRAQHRVAVFETLHALPATKLPPSMLRFKETLNCFCEGRSVRAVASVTRSFF
jgi:hypothetical protein